MRRLTALLPLLAVLGACEPTCVSTCRQVLACDPGSSRVAIDECEASCVWQQQLYDGWQDQEKIDRFAEHKRCLVGATCDEIREGACYDEALYLFDLPSSDPG